MPLLQVIYFKFILVNVLLNWLKCDYTKLIFGYKALIHML